MMSEPTAKDHDALALLIHGLSLVLGVGMLMLGLLAMFVDNSLHDAPNVIAFPIISSLLLLGASTIWLSWLSFQRSRAAWSYLLAIAGTLTPVCLFAAPRFHNSFDLAWVFAFMPSLMFAIVTALLIALAPRYRH